MGALENLPVSRAPRVEIGIGEKQSLGMPVGPGQLEQAGVIGAGQDRFQLGLLLQYRQGLGQGNTLGKRHLVLDNPAAGQQLQQALRRHDRFQQVLAVLDLLVQAGPAGIQGQQLRVLQHALAVQPVSDCPQRVAGQHLQAQTLCRQRQGLLPAGLDFSLHEYQRQHQHQHQQCRLADHVSVARYCSNRAWHAG